MSQILKSILKVYFLVLIPIFYCSLSLAEPAVLSLERIFQSPELEGKLILHLKFSPQGERLSFLRPKTENYEILDLWEYDLTTGQPRLLVDSNSLPEAELSEEEKARRERLRITRKGIVEYFWSNLGQKIIFPSPEGLYLYDFQAAKPEPVLITKKKKSILDVKFSPTDRFVSYIREQNLILQDLTSKKEYPVTTEGRGTVSYGVAEFVAQEEMDRFTGYWWSKDEKYIAYTQVDEGPVKVVDRYEIDSNKIAVRKERYPETGTANAIVKLAVMKVEDVIQSKLSPQWIPLGRKQDIYLAHATWNSQHQFVYQIQSRDQKKLEIFSYDPRTKKNILLMTEKDDHWVNLNDDWRMLKKSPRMIWASERTGYKHLYLYQNDGKLIRPITHGQWSVDNLIGVDELSGWVYFTSGYQTPLMQQLYRIRLDETSEPDQLTKEEGWHQIKMSEKTDFFVDYFSSPMHPQQVFLHRASGERVSTLSSNEVIEGHPLYPYKEQMIWPEFGSFTGPSGDRLYYRIYKPKDFDPSRKYPLIVHGYGGPHSQVVNQSWGGKNAFFAQILLSKGFLVASFDNRGSPRRGKKFEDALYHSMGQVEVEDQVAGVHHLISLGGIDEKRVGFYGWSYGGYLALNLILKASDLFRSAVAVAPVTDFSLYDTHYTERYLGKPQDEPEVYKRANTLSYVSQLKGRLLVIHGMADDNVLFTNSTLLFKNLQQAGKLYESVTYPGSKHGITGKENQTHVYSTILDFFERSLK